MTRTLIILMTALLAHTPAHAINAKYRQQLERSGCTQVSEAQGCDITKTKRENAKAGFGTPTPAKDSKASKSPLRRPLGSQSQIREHHGHDPHRQP